VKKNLVQMIPMTADTEKSVRPNVESPFYPRTSNIVWMASHCTSVHISISTASLFHCYYIGLQFFCKFGLSIDSISAV